MPTHGTNTDLLTEGTASAAPAADAQPVYQALAARLRRAILDGEFPPDRRLPTEAELAAMHNVSRQTVRQAFSQLVAESLVYRVRGRGSFATPFSPRGAYLRSFGPASEVLSPSLDTELEVVEPLARRTDIEAAGRLRLASDDVMVAMFRRLHEGAPFRTTTTYIPVEIGQSIAGLDFLKQRGARAQTTIIELIERETPTPVAGAHQSITAVAAPPAIAAALELQPGAPLLRIDRLYYDLNGTPIYLAVNHFNPNRYSYRMEMRRSPR